MTEEDIELVQGYIDSHWGVTGEARAAAAVLARLAAAEAQVATLRELLIEAVAPDAIQNDEAWHPVCRYCGMRWGHVVRRRDDGSWLEVDISENHAPDCFVARSRAVLAVPAEPA